MLPYWYLFVSAAVFIPVGWIAGRGRLKAERTLRIAAEADVRVGEHDAARVEHQRQTIEALTLAVAGSDLPPRDAGLLDATALAADFPAPGTVTEVEAQARWDATMAAVDAFAEDVRAYGLTDPDDPLDVWPAEDDPAEQPTAVTELAERHRDDEPPNGGALAATITLPTHRPGDRRFEWSTWDPAKPLPDERPVVVPRAPAGYLRRTIARFRRRRPDVRLAWTALAVLPPVRHWLSRMLATSLHTARHAARRGAESWADHRDVLSARWHEERETAGRRLRWLVAERTGARWSLVLPELQASLRPARRTVLPAFPFGRCVP